MALGRLALASVASIVALLLATPIIVVGLPFLMTSLLVGLLGHHVLNGNGFNGLISSSLIQRSVGKLSRTWTVTVLKKRMMSFI